MRRENAPRSVGIVFDCGTFMRRLDQGSPIKEEHPSCPDNRSENDVRSPMLFVATKPPNHTNQRIQTPHTSNKRASAALLLSRLPAASPPRSRFPRQTNARSFSAARRRRIECAALARSMFHASPAAPDKPDRSTGLRALRACLRHRALLQGGVPRALSLSSVCGVCAHVSDVHLSRRRNHRAP